MSELIFVSPRQHVLVGDNAPIRISYFDSNIVWIENANIATFTNGLL